MQNTNRAPLLLCRCSVRVIWIIFWCFGKHVSSNETLHINCMKIIVVNMVRVWETIKFRNLKKKFGNSVAQLVCDKVIWISIWSRFNTRLTERKRTRFYRSNSFWTFRRYSIRSYITFYVRNYNNWVSVIGSVKFFNFLNFYLLRICKRTY